MLSNDLTARSFSNERFVMFENASGKDRIVTTCSLPSLLVRLISVCLASPSHAQVDYRIDSPWDEIARSGPDAKVPGWFYDLGITGLRARLVADEPEALLVKFDFPKSPCDPAPDLPGTVMGDEALKLYRRDPELREKLAADEPKSRLRSGFFRPPSPPTARRGWR